MQADSHLLLPRCSEEVLADPNASQRCQLIPAQGKGQAAGIYFLRCQTRMSKPHQDTITILLGIREQLLTLHNLTGPSLRPGSKCSWAHPAAVGRVCPDVLVASRHKKVPSASDFKCVLKDFAQKVPTSTQGVQGPAGKSWPKHRAVSQLLTSVGSRSWWLPRTSAQILLTCGSNSFFFLYGYIRFLRNISLTTLAT